MAPVGRVNFVVGINHHFKRDSIIAAVDVSVRVYSTLEDHDGIVFGQGGCPDGAARFNGPAHLGEDMVVGDVGTGAVSGI